MAYQIAGLRKVAMKLPDTEEGISCAGTALERAAFRAKKKTFLFLGVKELRLKLDDSLGEAKKLAAKEPEIFEVGGGGWVLVRYAGAKMAKGLLERWIGESHRLMTEPKKKK
jgi:hypothetical protein